jgi:hypothetical protein
MDDQAVRGLNRLSDSELALLQDQGAFGPQKNGGQRSDANDGTCDEQAQALGNRGRMKTNHHTLPFDCVG